MHRRHQDYSYCLLCGKHGEKVSRVLCRDTGATQRLIERVEGPLAKALDKHATVPSIKAVITKIHSTCLATSRN